MVHPESMLTAKLWSQYLNTPYTNDTTSLVGTLRGNSDALGCKNLQKQYYVQNCVELSNFSVAF